MDDKTYLGSLAEAKTIATLTAQRWHIFNQVSGKAPFDLVAVKDNKLLRISVKGTANKDKNGSYLVQIGKVRSNKKINKVYKFDPISCDQVAVYILEIDTVCFIPAKLISSGRTLSLRKEPSKSSNTKGYLIDKFLTMED